jgi:CRP-like cAMP-binding protein
MAVAGKREIRSQPAGLTTLITDDARQRLHAQVDLYLPSGLTDELFNHHNAVAYPKGSILFGQGSPAGLIFLLISGVVKFPARWVTQIGLLSGLPHRATF